MLLARRKSQEQDPRKRVLGWRLRKWREAQAMTQEAVAQGIGLTTGAYQHYEAGRSMPSLLGFLEIARVLAAEPVEFFVPPLSTDGVAEAASGYGPSAIVDYTSLCSRLSEDEIALMCEILDFYRWRKKRAVTTPQPGRG